MGKAHSCLSETRISLSKESILLYWLFGTIGPTPNKLAQYISRVSTPHVGAQFKCLNLNQKTEFWQIILLDKL